MSESLISVLGPIQERRRELESRPSYVKEVLLSGAETARKAAEETLKIAREVVHLL